MILHSAYAFQSLTNFFSKLKILAFVIACNMTKDLSIHQHIGKGIMIQQLWSTVKILLTFWFLFQRTNLPLLVVQGWSLFATLRKKTTGENFISYIIGFIRKMQCSLLSLVPPVSRCLISLAPLCPVNYVNEWKEMLLTFSPFCPSFHWPNRESLHRYRGTGKNKLLQETTTCVP